MVAVTKRNLQECSLGVCERPREFGAVSVDADGAKSIRLVLGVLRQARTIVSPPSPALASGCHSLHPRLLPREEQAERVKTN